MGYSPRGHRVGYDRATKQFPPERQYKRAPDLGSDSGLHYPVCPGSVSLCFHRTSASSPEFPGVSVTATKQWGVSVTAGLPVESSPTLRLHKSSGMSVGKSVSVLVKDTPSGEEQDRLPYCRCVNDLHGWRSLC